MLYVAPKKVEHVVRREIQFTRQRDVDFVAEALKSVGRLSLVPERVVEDAAEFEEVAESELVDEVTEESHVQWLDTSELGYDPMMVAENFGLQPNVALYKELVGRQFGVTQFSLYRPGDGGDHGTGRAIDFMVDTWTGDQIAAQAISHMQEWGIKYVIWKQQIYGDWGGGWRWMEDRGSVTANHYDHVHISFY